MARKTPSQIRTSWPELFKVPVKTQQEPKTKEELETALKQYVNEWPPVIQKALDGDLFSIQKIRFFRHAEVMRSHKTVCLKELMKPFRKPLPAETKRQSSRLSLHILLIVMGEENITETLRILKNYGGRSFDVPAMSRKKTDPLPYFVPLWHCTDSCKGKNITRAAHDGHLKDLIGRDAARRFIRFYAGTRVWIPSCKNIERLALNYKIKRAYTRKKETGAYGSDIETVLAAKYGKSMNEIRRIIKKPYSAVYERP